MRKSRAASLEGVNGWWVNAQAQTESVLQGCFEGYLGYLDVMQEAKSTSRSLVRKCRIWTNRIWRGIAVECGGGQRLGFNKGRREKLPSPCPRPPPRHGRPARIPRPFLSSEMSRDPHRRVTRPAGQELVGNPGRATLMICALSRQMARPGSRSRCGASRWTDCRGSRDSTRQ